MPFPVKHGPEGVFVWFLKEEQEWRTRNDGRRGNICFPHDNDSGLLPCLIRGVAMIVEPSTAPVVFSEACVPGMRLWVLSRQSEILGGLVYRDDIGEGRPGQNAEGVVNIGRPADAVEDAGDTWGTGQDPKSFAGKTLGSAL